MKWGQKIYQLTQSDASYWRIILKRGKIIYQLTQSDAS
jgi:hypothetical protein